MATAEVDSQENFASDFALDSVHHDWADFRVLPEVPEVIVVGAAITVFRDRLILIALLTLLVSDLSWKIDILDGKSIAIDVVVQCASAARQLMGMLRIYMRDRLSLQDERFDD